MGESSWVRHGVTGPKWLSKLPYTIIAADDPDGAEMRAGQRDLKSRIFFFRPKIHFFHSTARSAHANQRPKNARKSRSHGDSPHRVKSVT